MTDKKESTDVLLWLGGAVLAGVAVTWLVVSQPWSSGDELEPLSTPDPLAASIPDQPDDTAAADAAAVPGELDAATAAGGTKEAPVTELGGALDSPLRMAELAMKAGMLLEPEGYSAWSLYQEALEVDPSSAAARSGLQDVADILVNRASVAMEQARIADATRLIETVRGVLPEHEAAARVAEELSLPGAADEPPPPPAQVAAAEPAPKPRVQQAAQPKPKLEQPKISAAPQLAKAEPPPPPAPKPRDRYAEAASAFDTAMAEGKLLAPEEASARHYLLEMADLEPDAEGTAAARQALNEILLARADEAIEAVDTVAADVWLTQAEELGADQLLTESARLALEQKVIARDAARPISVAELSVLKYVPPRYPSRAVDRDLEGWVDVEFTVSKEGQPENITVVDASHQRFFRKEAINAVGQWQFEPHVVRGTTVAQRTFARISFKLQ